MYTNSPFIPHPQKKSASTHTDNTLYSFTLSLRHWQGHILKQGDLQRNTPPSKRTHKHTEKTQVLQSSTLPLSFSTDTKTDTQTHILVHPPS